MPETLGIATANTSERLERERLRGVLTLGELAVRYAGIERSPQHPDGRHENDAEHSHMLTMVATHLAHEYYPQLDQGLIAQFCSVHDYPEIECGDVSTLGISEEARIAKEAAEKVAAEKIIAQLPEPWASLLARYEAQAEPEARFVRLVDKIMPSIMQTFGNGHQVFREQYGVTTPEQLDELHAYGLRRIEELFPEFPEVLHLRRDMYEHMKSTVFAQ